MGLLPLSHLSIGCGVYNPHSAYLQRFEKLCRYILSSMDAENEPKVSGMGAGKSPRSSQASLLALKIPAEYLDFVGCGFA